MKYYSYEEFKTDVNRLAKEIKPFWPDVILAVARGGMTLGHFLSEALEIRSLYSLNSIHYEETKKLDDIQIFNIPDLSRAKKVLVVDDIIDSGETMIEIIRDL
ncbi:MAG: phosphoribosyltransferase family protein, partial [Sulfurospirillaceae bacterium]|nr:phosphoribosyltransferase family protein [Sulfurospirillaceae bacterium]